MKRLPVIAIAVLGAASACSVNHETTQHPVPPPVPAKTAAATTAPVDSATTTAPPTPGMMVVNDYDPPLRIPVER